MVNTFGQWTPEKDYSTYPQEKWCDYDYVANYIRQQNYTPQTSIENLVQMIISHLEGEIENREMTGVESDFIPMYNDNLMINVEAVDSFVMASGGLKEFDYEC